MRITTILLTLALCMGLAGCALEKQARDTAAALQGSLLAAQAKYQASCSAEPHQNICEAINRAISAQNGLITTTEAYCGWAAMSPPPDRTAKCVPVRGAENAFRAAIANAQEVTKEIKGAM